MLALAAGYKQVVLQADFPNAHVNADIEEDVYVCQPKGFEEKDGNEYVCKLQKALYGCPISDKKWNEALTEAITSLGYKKSDIDHCLFYRSVGDFRDLMVIYVDDVLVTSDGGEERAGRQLDELGEMFTIKKLGRACHILGIGIHQGEDGIFVEETAYAQSILEETDFLGAKPRNAPWDSHLTENDE